MIKFITRTNERIKPKFFKMTISSMTDLMKLKMNFRDFPEQDATSMDRQVFMF